MRIPPVPRRRAGDARIAKRLRAALLASVCATAATAQTSVYPIRRIDRRLDLDARLRDPVWSETDSISDFRQREPAEGAPASERTVVRILRGPDQLYVAVRAYDADPGAIRSTQLRRDANLASDDNVTILIDSYRDRR